MCNSTIKYTERVERNSSKDNNRVTKLYNNKLRFLVYPDRIILFVFCVRDVSRVANSLQHDVTKKI